MIMSHCPQCGTPLGEKQKFCHNCGCDVINQTIDDFTDKFDNEEVADEIKTRVAEHENVYINEKWDNEPQEQVVRADRGKRFMAMILDMTFTFIIGLPAMVMAMMAMMNTGLFPALFNNGIVQTNTIFILYYFISILLCIPPLIYPFIKDGMKNGQSFGKRLMGIRVISLDDGMPCTYARSAIRQLITSLLCNVAFIGLIIEPLIVLIDDDGRRIADRVANTFVVQDE